MSATIASIPMPARKPLAPSGQRATKYDLAALRPGTDDCLIDSDSVNIKKAQSRLTSAVASYRKRPGNESHRFSVRTFTDPSTGHEVVGVWRIADKAPEAAADAQAPVATDVQETPAQDANVDASTDAPL